MVSQRKCCVSRSRCVHRRSFRTQLTIALIPIHVLHHRKTFCNNEMDQVCRSVQQHIRPTLFFEPASTREVAAIKILTYTHHELLSVFQRASLMARLRVLSNEVKGHTHVGLQGQRRTFPPETGCIAAAFMEPVKWIPLHAFYTGATRHR